LNFEVKYYSGYKGEERPRSVVIGKREFKIEKIIWRKRILDKKSGKRYEVFKVKMDGETVEIKKYKSGEWAIFFCEK